MSNNSNPNPAEGGGGERERGGGSGSSTGRKLIAAVPWRLSPRKSKKRVVTPFPRVDEDGDVVDEEEIPSPTGVLDYQYADAAQQPSRRPRPQQPLHQQPQPQQQQQRSDIFRLAPPTALAANGHSSSRRSRQYFSALPTLDETSSSGSGSSSLSFEEEEEEEEEDAYDATSPLPGSNNTRSPLSPSRRQPLVGVGTPGGSPRRKLILPPTETTSSTASTPPECGNSSSTASTTLQQQRRGSSGKVAHKTKLTFSERMAELRTKAADHSDRGEDSGALLVYKRALKLARHETARVKAQLSDKKSQSLHPSALPSIASRLHEDWLQVGLSIADTRREMAVLCERIGDYDRALVCLREAGGVYKRQLVFLKKNPGHPVAPQVLARAEDLKVTLRKMQVAKDSFADRKQLHEEVILLRRALADNHNNESDERRKLHAALQEQTARALALETKVLGGDHPQVADTLSLVSTLELETGDAEQAVEHLDRAISIAEKSVGLKHPLTGELLLQMARLYATTGAGISSSATTTNGRSPSRLQNPQHQTNAADRAMEYYQRAVVVFRASEHNPRLIGSTLNEISVIHIRQRHYDRAVANLEEALEAFARDDEEQRLNEQKNHQEQQQQQATMIPTETVQIWRNLGECYAHRKEFAKAIDAFVSALDLQRDARKVYDAAVSEYLAETGHATTNQTHNPLPPLSAYLVDDASIGDTLRRLGKSYMGSGKLGDAVAVYGEALIIHRAAVVQAVNPQLSGGRPNEGLPERQDQLAHTLFCIAEAREAMGDRDEALRIYSESMQLRLFSDAHRQEKRQNMVHCAMCLRGIGNVHLLKQEYEAANKVFEDALSYCVAHGVPDDHAIVATIKQQLEDSESLAEQQLLAKEVQKLKRQASKEIAKGDLDQAVDSLTQMMSCRKAILKLMKDNKQDASDEKLATAHTLKLFGEVLVQKGDYLNAERAFGDALKLFKKGVHHQQPEEGDDEMAAAVRQVKSHLKRLRTLQKG